MQNEVEKEKNDTKNEYVDVDNQVNSQIFDNETSHSELKNEIKKLTNAIAFEKNNVMFKEKIEMLIKKKNTMKFKYNYYEKIWTKFAWHDR